MMDLQKAEFYSLQLTASMTWQHCSSAAPVRPCINHVSSSADGFSDDNDDDEDEDDNNWGGIGQVMK